MGKVLLTGATGYIGAHILEDLVKKGFDIVSTVRNRTKADWLRQLHPNAPIEFAYVDSITEDGAFDRVFSDHNDIEYVIHAASPVGPPKNDPVKDSLDPAMKGTGGILKSVLNYGSMVRHVVVTSSFAAVKNSYNVNSQDTLSEKSWNPITFEDAVKDTTKTYAGSKTLAEKIVWEFVDQYKPNFSVTTILPGFCLGPLIHPIFSPDGLTSPKPVYMMLHLDADSTDRPEPKMLRGCIDVRDVALAHVRAIERPKESAGKRWFLVSQWLHTQQVLDIVNRRFPELKGKVAVGKPFAEGEFESLLAQYPKLDTTATRAQSGIQFHPLEESIVDTVKSLIQLEKQWN
uniref:ARAD1A11198p n=1 Tax=Blastobotrys adeninivorans TaxID=409370 RepID=A0A060SYB8_BLAAD